MELIFIPRLTKKHLLFLAFSISSFFREFMYFYDVDQYIDYDTNLDDIRIREEVVQKRYFDILQNVFSDLFQGILFLLETIRKKKEASKLKNKKINSAEEELANKDKTTSKCGIIIILMKISFVDLFCQLIFLIFVLIFQMDNVIDRRYGDFVLIIDITSRFLFCRYILNTYFYKHHIASMIVNTIVFFIIFFIDIKNIIFYYININYDERIRPYHIIIFGIVLVIVTIAYSYEDVLNKIALTKGNITPYSLLFYKGLLQVPLVTIITFLILLYRDKDKDDSVFEIFFKTLEPKFRKLVIIKRSIFFVFNILRSICLVQVIDNFSSQYLSILRVLEFLLFFIYFLIYDIIKENKLFELYEKIILIISFIILVLTSLVYNEIVVLNIFGLQDYTQHGLDVLADKDLRDAISETSEIPSEKSSDSRSESQSIITQNVSFND